MHFKQEKDHYNCRKRMLTGYLTYLNSIREYYSNSSGSKKKESFIEIKICL